MAKRYYTKKEQEQLKCNPNVQAISEKAITYKDEFKRHFIAEHVTFLLLFPKRYASHYSNINYSCISINSDLYDMIK